MIEFLNKLGKFQKSKSGNVFVTVALVTPVLLGGIGVATDYAKVYQYQSNLQSAVDSAALATAKEIALSSATSTTLNSVAKNYVHANSGLDPSSLRVNTKTDRELATITVHAAFKWTPMFIHHLDSRSLPIRVSATATLKGTGKICVVGLNNSKRKTVELESNARLVGQNCGVYSNSTHEKSIKVGTASQIDAKFICSAGGIKGYQKAFFNPTPVVDCPPVGDPLAQRPVPIFSGCTKRNYEVTNTTIELQPGVYCKGLAIRGNSKVKLKSGMYVIKKGGLIVEDGATLIGHNVGIHLTGKGAVIDFQKGSSIDLSAMENGDMAGILFWGERNKGRRQTHKISSDDARTLLGTIYLPDDRLEIDSSGPVADQSAYTAIIADAIDLRYGPTLVLNSEYEATNVPVPESLKGGEPYLIK